MRPIQPIVKEIEDANAKLHQLLREAGIDPDQPLSGQGVSHLNSRERRLFIKDGKVIARMIRARYHWEIVEAV